MKAPTNKSPNCNVDRYIGSDFDAVQAVADNLNIIKPLGGVADDLEKVVDNIDDIVRLADNLEEYQVTETITITPDQTLITLSKVIPTSMQLFLYGQHTDRGRLLEGYDYTVSSGNTIQLPRTYPEGTKLIAVQTIVANSNNTSVVYADKTVFNRPVVAFGLDQVLKDEFVAGNRVRPLLTYNYKQYYPQQDLDVEYKITSAVVFAPSETKIRILTDRGAVDFDSEEAKALPNKEISDLMQHGLTDILVEPPKQWEKYTWIYGVAHQIGVDGITYIPKKVPFETLGSWSVDKDNWNRVLGKLPKEVTVTTATIDAAGMEYSLVLSAPNPINVARISNVTKLSKVLLVPEDNNITLVHSTDGIRLVSGTTLTLSPNTAYEFFADHNGVLRQVF